MFQLTHDAGLSPVAPVPYEPRTVGIAEPEPGNGTAHLDSTCYCISRWVGYCSTLGEQKARLLLTLTGVTLSWHGKVQEGPVNTRAG